MPNEALPPNESIAVPLAERMYGLIRWMFLRSPTLVVGQNPPALDLISATGFKVYPERFRGKVVAVNFCATWCVACQWQKRDWTDLQKLHAKELEVLTIFCRQGWMDISSFATPELARNSCPSTDTILRGWGVFPSGHLPVCVVIDKLGVVREAWRYYRPKSWIEGTLKQYMYPKAEEVGVALYSHSCQR